MDFAKIKTAPSAQSAFKKWSALCIATMSFMYIFLCRFIWTSVQADVASEFFLSLTETGAYMSSFFVGYLITQIPGGLLADKFQPKWILAICTLLGGVTTAMISTMSNLSAGIILRIITGIGAGCVMACCSKIIAVNFGLKERPSAMGVLLSAPAIGIMLANFIGTPLNKAFGWRNSFLYVGLFSIVITLLIVVFIDKVPEAPKNLNKSGMLEGLKAFFTDRDQLILGISGFMFLFLNQGFSTWARVFLGNIGFGPEECSNVVTVFSLAGIFASCFSGNIAKALKIGHKQFILITLIGMSALTIVFFNLHSYTMFIVVGFIYGAFSYLPSTHYTSMATERAGERYVATAASTQNFLFQTSGLVQPLIIGDAVDKTGNNNFIFYILFAVSIPAILFLLLVKDKKAVKK